MKNLKTFQARTMAEAIEQVKRRLGRDAVILHTRTLTQGGLFGFGGHPMVEVTAAAGKDAPPTPRRPPAKPAPEGNPPNGPPCASASSAGGTCAWHATVGGPALQAELGELRSMVQHLVQDARRRQVPTLPQQLLEAYTRLIQADVAEDLAVQLVERVRAEWDLSGTGDPQIIRERLAAYVESMLPVAGPIRLGPGPGPTVIALVGPTGVGKTTTVAKLAANLSLRESKKVGLVTIDTYRIAAVEQLRTYARIINVPLAVVMTPSHLRSALENLKDRDVILLDTAGRSQNDAIKLNELKCYLEEAKAHEVHLVLSTTYSRRVLQETIERFGLVGIDRVIFTKLDEAVGFGAILSCLTQADAKLSYLTVGQNVPEDIEIGRSRRVAELIVNLPEPVSMAK